MPPDNPARQLVWSLVHAALKAAIDAGLTGDDLAGEVQGHDVAADAKLQVLIRLARWDGPPRLAPETAERIDRFPSPPLPMPLRDVEAAILQAAPPPQARPVSMKKLARLAGYAYTPHFRTAVNSLAQRGYLSRVGGVRRTDRCPPVTDARTSRDSP